MIHSLSLPNSLLEQLEQSLYGPIPITSDLFFKLSSEVCDGRSDLLFPQGDARTQWSVRVFNSSAPSLEDNADE